VQRRRAVAERRRPANFAVAEAGTRHKFSEQVAGKKKENRTGKAKSDRCAGARRQSDSPKSTASRSSAEGTYAVAAGRRGAPPIPGDSLSTLSPAGCDSSPVRFPFWQFVPLGFRGAAGTGYWCGGASHAA